MLGAASLVVSLVVAGIIIGFPTTVVGLHVTVRDHQKDDDRVVFMWAWIISILACVGMAVLCSFALAQIAAVKKEVEELRQFRDANANR